MTSEPVSQLRTLAIVTTLLLGACEAAEKDAPQLATWALTPALVIGGDDEGAASFSDIRGIAVDGQGRIYVLEAQAQEVRVFDASGAFVRRIGRNGDGPGEFRGANGIVVDESDHLWVYDPQARRVTIFDSAGNLAVTHAVTIQSYGYVWEGGVDSGKRLYDSQFIRVDTLWTPFIRRTNLERMTSDTLAWPDCEAASIPGYEFHSERRNGVMGVPFAPRRYVRYDPDGYAWCADTRTISIGQYRLGDTVPFRTLVANATPAAVTTEERDSAIAEVRDFGAKIGRGDPDFGLIPAVKPVLQAADPDDEGNLWVRAMTNEGPRIFVFDTAGQHLAVVPFMAGVSPWLPLTIRRSRAYAIAMDSLDVPVVRTFLVRRGADR